jgi:glutaminase
MAELAARVVATGPLPPAGAVAARVAAVHAELADDEKGLVSAAYPSLARVDPSLWGLTFTAVDGSASAAGDADVTFVVMSVSKPFVFALVASHLGVREAADLVGMEATGLPYTAPSSADAPSNPMVNGGAIATSALVPGGSAADRWAAIHAALSAFAGRDLELDEETYVLARDTNLRNRDLAARLATAGLLAGDPGDAVDLYTRQCCLLVTARDLGAMGATLANGGVQPFTGEQVVAADAARAALVAMTLAGLYETSGRWLLSTGLPAKSGIGGGLVAVAPGKGAIGAFSPRLDGAGTSTRGARAASALARTLGLDLLASEPASRRSTRR